MPGTTRKKKTPIDPTYYTNKKIEPIVVIESWGLGFKLGSALKYLARCEETGTRKSDLIKAANYCFREATGRWLPKELLNEGKRHNRISRNSKDRAGEEQGRRTKKVHRSSRADEALRKPAKGTKRRVDAPKREVS